MTEQDALLARVRVTPADDTPRLVYADWLDEQPKEQKCSGCHGTGRIYATVNPGCDNEYDVDDGPCKSCRGKGTVPTLAAERAEFIRVQVELSRENAIPWRYSCEVRDALRLRERELWAAHSREWFVDEAIPMGVSLGDHAGPPPDVLGIVSRGFISHIRGPLAAFWGEGECGRCGGQGHVDRQGRFGCPMCGGHRRGLHGTGRVSGPTPAFRGLREREPVEFVDVTDLNPEPPGQFCGWVRDDHHTNEEPASGDHLPPALFDLLLGGEEMGDTVIWKRYDTIALARAALSAALLVPEVPT